MDLLGNFGRVADQFEVVANHVEHAAALDARAGLLVVEPHGDVDGHLAVLADAEEVDVDRSARNRVELHVLGQGPERLAGRIDHHDRIHEVAGRKHPGEELFLDVDSQRLLFVAIDNGGYPSIATKRPGGSLASPVARLGGQRQLFAHACIP